MSTEFLNVKQSLSNQRWIGPSIDHERIAYGLTQKHTISLLTALILAKRGIKSNELESYLLPKIKDLMPDPYSLQDMQRGSERFIKAIKNREKICIFADYDVDGTVSASVLLLWLKYFDITPEIYIPDRINEGYGPNLTAMAGLAKSNSLIICVDCGTVSHDAIEIANQSGADVLVLDHHTVDETLPPAFAIINPKRKDESGELDYLCAAGVVFLFLVSLTRLLRESKISAPNTMNFLDLVALATVADVVPLVKLNRAFVSQGLKVLAKRNRPGLVALIDEAKIRAKPNTYHLGYLIGPRINAAGRLSDARFAVNLLTSTSVTDAEKIASKLSELNIKRRSLENNILQEALSQIEREGKENDSVIWVASDRWHPGVIGIIAARLKEKFQVPSLVFSIDNSGRAIGSARSILGVDIGQEIKHLVGEGLLLSGGGHKMAAGIKLNQNELPSCMSRLTARIEKNQKKHQFDNVVNIDCLITVQGATIEIVEEMQLAGPFGADNPIPIIAIANCKIKFIKVLNDKHIKFTCVDSSRKKLEAIFFNGVGTRVGDKLLNHVGESFHLCGTLEVNDWGGYRRVVLQVKDIALI